MNYQEIYDRLMSRAKSRAIHGYTEIHHVIPKCLGGDDSDINLVKLTPEEHYVAHQLLVKMHPTHHGLKYAAIRMTSGNRRSNKLYGWLRKSYAESKRGRKNSPEHIAKVATAHRGMKRSDETKRRIAESKRGKPRPESVRNAVGKASKERWAAMSMADRQKKSEEARIRANRRWAKVRGELE